MPESISRRFYEHPTPSSIGAGRWIRRCNVGASRGGQVLRRLLAQVEGQAFQVPYSWVPTYWNHWAVPEPARGADPLASRPLVDNLVPKRVCWNEVRPEELLGGQTMRDSGGQTM